MGKYLANATSYRMERKWNAERRFVAKVEFG